MLSSLLRMKAGLCKRQAEEGAERGLLHCEKQLNSIVFWCLVLQLRGPILPASAMPEINTGPCEEDSLVTCPEPRPSTAPMIIIILFILTGESSQETIRESRGTPSHPRSLGSPCLSVSIGRTPPLAGTLQIINKKKAEDDSRTN